MNRITLSLSLLLVLPVALPAQAQKKQSGFRNLGITGLAAHRAVHKELKLSDEQAAALKQAAAEARKGFQESQKLKGQARREKSQPVSAKLRAAINKTLNPEQKKRFLQLEIQYSGSWIFQRKDVGTALELTKEQRREVRKIAKEARETADKLRETITDENRREVQQKITSSAGKARAAAIKLLTDDQQKKWKQVTGKPFELPRRGRKKKQ